MARSSATPWFFRCGEVVFPLKVGPAIIGRGSDVEVWVDDDLVSRRHAELEVSSTGVLVRDVGSRHGIYLGDRKLAKGETVSLSDGDSLVIGETTLVLLKERKRGRMPTIEAVLPQREFGPPEKTSSKGMELPYESFLQDADRAAAEGDAVRLETATHVAIQMVMNGVRKGLAHDSPAIGRVVAHALSLAETKRGWIERVFQLYTAGPMPIPIDVLTTIDALARTVGLASRAPLEAYIEAMRPTLEQDARGRAVLTALLRVLSR